MAPAVRRRVLILLHPGTTAQELSRWAIHGLSAVWNELGIEVGFLTSTRRVLPADVLIVHIDLSVVPEVFLEFAAQYPVAVNGKVRDIRKTTISKQRVLRGDDWDGPVIVKSDLNCCALGERVLREERGRTEISLPRYPFAMRSQQDYRVYRRVSEVPDQFFEDESVIVERFLPEREGDTYFCRSHHFLGSKTTTVRLGSREPIVVGHVAHVIEDVEPHEDVLRARVELGLDYGKIDYVVHDGRAVVLDVNKTTGEGGVSTDPKVLAMRRHRALGIFDFLPV